MKIDTPTARAKLPPRTEPYWHRLQPGQAIGYRKLKTKSVWLAKYRPSGGRRQMKTLGDGFNYEQAVERARQWFKEIDVAANVEDPGLTVAKTVEDYLDFRKRERSPAGYRIDRLRADNHILPALGRVRVVDLKAGMIQQWLESLVVDSDDANRRRASMDSANKCLTVLRAALNRAFQQERVPDDSAWRRVKPFKATTVARKTFLTGDQPQRLINACEDDALRDLVAFGLMTGARFGEIAAARVLDFDLAAGLWTVEVSKTRGEHPRITVLTDEAVDLVRRCGAGASPDALVFARVDDLAWHHHNIRRPFLRAASRAELPSEASYYCLRHTHISKQLLAGMPAQALAENTGTSVKMIEMHYGKFLHSDKRAMLRNGAIKLDLPESNVVPMEASHAG